MSRGTQGHIRSLPPFAYGAVTLYDGPFQEPSTREKVSYSLSRLGSEQMRLTTPERHGLPGREASPVWAVPRSFATTRGISVDFFSSGYLDVSVPLLTSPVLRVQTGVTDVYVGGVPPFGYPRLRQLDGLPRLFAALLRPSSALGTKASTVGP